MNNQVLFIGYGGDDREKIDDFLVSRDSIAHFAQSTQEAIHLLDEKPIKTVVLSIHEMNDAAILKYVNQYYPDKEVIVSATREFKEVIDVLSKGHYSVLKQPLRMNDLVALLF